MQPQHIVVSGNFTKQRISEKKARRGFPRRAAYDMLWCGSAAAVVSGGAAAAAADIAAGAAAAAEQDDQQDDEPAAVAAAESIGITHDEIPPVRWRRGAVSVHHMRVPVKGVS